MAKFQSQKKNFINVGVSEQVMIGICAGLALSGNEALLTQLHHFLF